VDEDVTVETVDLVAPFAHAHICIVSLGDQVLLAAVTLKRVMAFNWWCYEPKQGLVLIVIDDAVELCLNDLFLLRRLGIFPALEVARDHLVGL